MNENRFWVSFPDLLSRGVTEQMINNRGPFEHGIRLPVISNGHVSIPWIWEEVGPVIGTLKRIIIRAGRSNVATLIIPADTEVTQSWVQRELAKEIISEAHVHDEFLKNVTHLTRLVYQRLAGVDARGPEMVALLHGPLGVMIYHEPRWRSSNDDTGEIKTLDEVGTMLLDIVPKSVFIQVTAQISAYVASWKQIHGVEPELTAFTKKVPAGIKCYVVIGTGKGAIDMRFNYCTAIDKDTLQPVDFIRSVLKDFK